MKIYRPGVKQDDENSGGWFSWIWSWSGEKKDEQNQEIKGSSMIIYWYSFRYWNLFESLVSSSGTVIKLLLFMFSLSFSFADEIVHCM